MITQKTINITFLVGTFVVLILQIMQWLYDYSKSIQIIIICVWFFLLVISITRLVQSKKLSSQSKHFTNKEV
jgi:hypothetical protein